MKRHLGFELALALLAGCGLWLGIAGYQVAADDTYGGEALKDLAGIRWEKELFSNLEEDYHAYLDEHCYRNDYMEDAEAEEFPVYGTVVNYHEGLALGYDLPSSTWYCFDEDKKTVFTVKTEFPPMTGAYNIGMGFFQKGLAALPLSAGKTCVVDRTGRRVIPEFPGGIYICRDGTALFVYSAGHHWTCGVARLGEGKLKGVLDDAEADTHGSGAGQV